MGLWRARCLEGAPANADYQFSGGISQAVLDNYLSRSLAMEYMYIWSQFTDPGSAAQYQDNLRMVKNVGSKHLDRVSNLWWGAGETYDVEAVFTASGKVAADVHANDPDVILGCDVFEVISSDANNVPIPSWVFDAFGLPQQTRNFDYSKILYADQRLTSDSGLPAVDITQLEARMWYYYWAKRYIDLGYEHFDMGQIQSTCQADLPKFTNLWDVVTRIRKYASLNARRKWILISAQTYPADKNGNPSWGGVHGVADASGNLVFDFYYMGLLPKENPNSPQDAVLAFYGAAIFGRSLGGTTPSGFPCGHQLYGVQLDEGNNPNPGVAMGYPFVWGWSQPGWFEAQPYSYRADWLRYAQNWVRANDPAGHFRPTGQTDVVDPVKTWYHANTPWPSDSSLDQGVFKEFNDEPVIKEIWSGTADPNLLNGDFSRPVLQGTLLDWVAPEVPSWTFGSPIVTYGQAPTEAPIPSGQASISMSGIARAGSQYLGSVALASGQQAAFLLGAGSISQAISFPGLTSYALQFSASQRVTSGVADAQEVQVWFDGVLLWRYVPAASFGVYNVFLGTPPAGTHTVRIAGGSQDTDTAILINARVVQASVSANAPLVTAVVNAASGTSDIAPGSLISIYGSQLAQATGPASGEQLPLTLNGAVVSVNGMAIPLSYASVSPGQINAQLPFEIPPGVASLVVDVASGASAPAPLTVVPTAPEVFRVSGSRGLAVNQDGTINGPDAPAGPSSYILVYVTGQGAVDHSVPTGAPGPSSPLARPIAPVSATLGGQPMTVLFLGLAPGFVGVCQANLQVPNVAPGDQSLVIQIGSASSQPVTITVASSQ